MRCINYNTFYDDLNEWVTDEDRNLPPNENWYISVLIAAEENQVEAIPVDWIHQYLNRKDEIHNLPVQVELFMMDMIDKYRKERAED